MKKIVITSPIAIANETTLCNELLRTGVDYIHLRRPDGSLRDFIRFIELIDPRYRHRVVLHSHFELCDTYRCGVHLNAKNRNLYQQYKHCPVVSTSCHSLVEVEDLTFCPSYLLLSPIFDSISKIGYISSFDFSELKSWFLKRKETVRPKIIALGGVDFGKLSLCQDMGFEGIAFLGAVWNHPDKAIAEFNAICRPEVLSIAGFDPCSSAGITADVRIADSMGCYCLGICSGVTFQNELQFEGVEWMSASVIKQQLEILLRKHTPRYIKIGLIENIKTLQMCVEIANQIKDVTVVWDPILKASAGFSFHSIDPHEVEKLLHGIRLITPNDTELQTLFGTTDIDRLQQIVCKTNCNLLWKGGHKADEMAEDILITPTEVFRFALHRSGWDKHGTGCAYSTAVIALLAQGIILPHACAEAQKRVSELLNIHPGKLIFHSMKSKKDLRKDLFAIPLQYITDHRDDLTVCEQVELVCQGGVKWIQLRMKDGDTDQWLQTGALVKAICERYGALFIVNDRVDIARQLDADGVHLGKEDMNPIEARALLGNDKIIGATCNNAADIQLRAQQQVDYIGLGPYTFTTTKKKLSPVLGLEGYSQLMEWMKQEQIAFPVHAIGGISIDDIAPIMQTGVSGIALSGLIKNSDNIPQRCKDIISILNNTVTNTIAEKNISL